MENEKNTELTDEQLNGVSGGCQTGACWRCRNEPHYSKCPKCGAGGGEYNCLSDFEREVECVNCGCTYMQFYGKVPDPECKNI